MRVYLSGPITGVADYMQRFDKAERKLLDAGYTVVNPAMVNSMLPEDTTYNEYMMMSFCMMDMCDAIYMMDGWQDSRGANMELRRAKELGLDIIYGGMDVDVEVPQVCLRPQVQEVLDF